MTLYYAHTAPKRGKGDWETQLEHAVCTSELAGRMGSRLEIGSEMSRVGLLHDMGKSSDGFQSVLNGAGTNFDHWTSGALIPWVAESPAKGLFSFYSALAIRGHHKGLRDGDVESFMYLRENAQAFPADRELPGENPDVLLIRLLGNHPLPKAEPDPLGSKDLKRSYSFPVASMLDIRMRLSVLVDADWTATQAHFHRTQTGERVFPPVAPQLQPDEALARLESEIERLRMQAQGSQQVQQARDKLTGCCVRAASMPMGLFTLTAPTGSGKTLAMLRFALEHARLNALERIIVVLPYLTIIEQSANTYQRLLADLSTPGNPYVLQDHSLAEAPDLQDDGNSIPRLRPNWAQPLIVTTSVQFFQSLFAADPGGCRKLHSLANSVILFDEAQTLPKSVVVPTLAALSHLSARYHSSVVFSTATQPAFDQLAPLVRDLASEGWAPREIVPESLRLHEDLRRVVVHWPTIAESDKGLRSVETVALETIADQMVQTRRCLCILNTKKQVSRLYRLLEERRHTSHCVTTNLCPRHREQVLTAIRQALNQKDEACLCVATQCLEAGVDIDFPVVFREWAPLPSLAQAAGRCNRNGRQPQGEFHVFKLDESSAPDLAYKQGMGATEGLFRSKCGMMDLFDPNLYKEYDQVLYSLDEGSISNNKIIQAILERRFDVVAKEYRLIDQHTSSVLVPYDAEMFEELSRQALQGKIDSRWERSARMISVNLYRPTDNSHVLDVLVPIPSFKGRGRDASADWYILSDPAYYDPVIGLDLPRGQIVMMP